MLIDNRRARHIFLHAHALSGREGGDLARLIDRIGFVQLDSINTLARAHDMILFARQDGFRPSDLKSLHQDQRALFEHWTHDASLIPMHAYPFWRARFDANRARLADVAGAELRAEMDAILRHIADHGPVTTRDVGLSAPRPKGGWWDWSPSKKALEWLWRTGDLAITARQGFAKVYDLTARVIPEAARQRVVTRAELIDWAASTALRNLGFATAREIANYYAAITPAEAKSWAADRPQVQIMGAGGAVQQCYVAALDAPEPAPILRLLSPFDPALRDRNRMEFLFGFRYRIEVFVPEAKRQYGYYVFPILQGDQLIGRMDVKAHRQEGVLRVRALWAETPMTQRQFQALEQELQRLVPFSGCARLEYAPDWVRA